MDFYSQPGSQTACRSSLLNSPSQLAILAAALFIAGSATAADPAAGPAAAATPPPSKPAPSSFPVFPKKDAGNTFADMKIFSTDGNPVRIPIDDWEGAKRRIKENPDWQAWLDGERAPLDAWMRDRHDRTDWVAGWFQFFVSPKDGSYLTWTPEEPGEETLSSPTDPKVKLTPTLHAAWVYGFRGRNATNIQEAARIYRLTGEEKYAKWAADQLDFYADNFEKWPLQTRYNKARLMGQSLDEAVDLARYVQAVLLLGDYAPPERKKKWFDLLFKPECEILNSSMQTIHNIACWQRSAVGQVALLYRSPELWKEAVDAPFGIRNQVARGITSDYLWFEQSFGYNTYTVSALLGFFQYAQMAGKGDSLRTEMASAENLLLAPIYLRFPDGKLPNPADSTKRNDVPLKFLASVYRIYPTGIGLQEALKTKGWDQLLDPPQPFQKAPPLPEVTSRNMESTRMAIIRRGPWQAFFHYGQLTRSHAQAEALNYELYFKDTAVSYDCGTVGYGSPLYRRYYTTGLAQNVPLIDEQGQEGWNPGKFLAFDPAGAVSAAQPDYRPNASAERALSIEGNAFRDVLKVKSKDGAAHRLSLVLHLQGRVVLPDSFQPDATFGAADRPPGFQDWTDTKSAHFKDHAGFDVQYPNNLTLHVQVSTPGEIEVTHASAPDIPPIRNDALYFTTQGSEAAFTTEFTPASGSK